MRDKPKRIARKDKVETLGLLIEREYAEMKRLYQAKRFVDLARFLEARRAVVVTPDYKKVRGGASANLWKKAHDQGATLEFRTANIFFGQAIGIHGVGQNAFDGVAFVTHEVHFNKKSSSGPKNDTAYLETTEKHQTRCQWF